jgi:hypothetical protein
MFFVSSYRYCLPSGYRRPPILSPFLAGTVGTSPGQTDSLEASPILLHVGTFIRTVPRGGTQPYGQFSKRVHPSGHPQDSPTGKIWKFLLFRIASVYIEIFTYILISFLSDPLIDSLPSNFLT